MCVASARARGLLWCVVSLAIFAANGCSTMNTEVAVERTTCCATDLSAYRRFAIDSSGIPMFLRDYFAEELASVLRGKGLVEEEPAQLRIALSYQPQQLAGASPVNIPDEPGEQVRTPQPREGRDDFRESLGGESPDRFMARVVVEMRTADSDDVVWSGVLSRVHTVSTGAYMHQRARAAINLAFSHLFEDFPESAPASRAPAD